MRRALVLAVATLCFVAFEAEADCGSFGISSGPAGGGGGTGGGTSGGSGGGGGDEDDPEGPEVTVITNPDGTVDIQCDSGCGDGNGSGGPNFASSGTR
jgi:hypothetical protein